MKKIIASVAIGLAAIIAATGWQSAGAAEKKELTFAVIQDIRMSVSAKIWEEPLNYVSKRVGAKFSFYATTSYASVVEAMLGGFVDIAKLGPKIYIVAAEKSKGTIVPVASFAREANIFNPVPCACYYGALITKKGGSFPTIESLKGKAVLALVDPGSTSGNALPRALFPKEIGGATLDDYFARIFYSGSHDASNLAVLKGKADAAFVAESTMIRMIDKGDLKKEDFNYLWRSPEVPIDVITVNTKTLSKEMIRKITKAFTDMHKDPEGRKMLKILGRAQFTPASDATFDSLRKILAAKAKLKKKK